MGRQRTGGPPRTLYERVAVAAGAGICGAAIAAGGSYTVFYGLAYGTVNSGAGGTLPAMFLLLVAVGSTLLRRLLPPIIGFPLAVQCRRNGRMPRQPVSRQK